MQGFVTRKQLKVKKKIKFTSIFDEIDYKFEAKMKEIEETKDSLPEIVRPMFNGKSYDEPNLKIDITKYGSDDLAPLYSYYCQLADYIGSKLSNARIMLEKFNNLYKMIKAYYNQLPDCQDLYTAKEDRYCYVQNKEKIRQIRLDRFEWTAKVELLDYHFGRCLRRQQTISREYTRTKGQWDYDKPKKR